MDASNLVKQFTRTPADYDVSFADLSTVLVVCCIPRRFKKIKGKLINKIRNSVNINTDATCSVIIFYYPSRFNNAFSHVETLCLQYRQIIDYIYDNYNKLYINHAGPFDDNFKKPLFNSIVEHSIKKKRNSEQNFDQVMFFGHSFGAVLCKRIITIANRGAKFCLQGNKKPYELVKKQSGWAKYTSRLILSSPLNRGIDTQKVPPIRKLGNAIYRAVGTSHKLESVALRGSPFITLTRIEWLRQSFSYFSREFSIIQYNGKLDRKINYSDSLDIRIDGKFEKYKNKSKARVFYHNISNVGHDLIDTEPELEMIIESGFLPLSGYRKLAKNNADIRAAREISSGLEMFQDFSVTRCVVLLHGIRDFANWTSHLGLEVKVQSARSRKSKSSKVPVFTPDYGYFSIWKLLTPWNIRRATYWLMHEYAEICSIYPRTKVSYFGYSNGTLLLAKALERYPSVKFADVILGNSIIKEDFDWQKYLKNKQVKRVKNLIATDDWVVGFMAKNLGVFKLGASGHDGFRAPAGKRMPVSNEKYVKGGHGASLSEDLWPAISKYLNGVGKVDFRTVQSRPASSNVIGNFWFGLVFKLVALILLLGIPVITKFYFGLDAPALGIVAVEIAILAYLLFLF